MKNKKYYIYLALIIPLSILLIISFILHYCFYFERDSGLFINLATEIFGIIITIVFVNWIIERNNKILWAKTDRRLTYKLQRYATLFIRKINGLFHLPTISIPHLKGKDPFIHIYQSYIRYVNETIIPNLKEYFFKFTQNDWEIFDQEMKNELNEVYKIQILFSPHFQPAFNHWFLDIIEKMEDIRQDYELFKDEDGTINENHNAELRESYKDDLIHLTTNNLTILFNKFENIINYLIDNKKEVPFFSPSNESE